MAPSAHITCKYKSPQTPKYKYKLPQTPKYTEGWLYTLYTHLYTPHAVCFFKPVYHLYTCCIPPVYTDDPTCIPAVYPLYTHCIPCILGPPHVVTCIPCIPALCNSSGLTPQVAILILFEHMLRGAAPHAKGAMLKALIRLGCMWGTLC